jgi:phage-related minor tail protein
MISKSDAIISLGVSGTFWELPSGEIKFADYYIGHKPTEEQIQAKIAELQAAEPMRLLRIERDHLLQQTDWTQNRDVQLDNDAAWREYRQALRDMPATQVPLLDENGVLYNITWPEKPE